MPRVNVQSFSRGEISNPDECPWMIPEARVLTKSHQISDYKPTLALL